MDLLVNVIPRDTVKTIMAYVNAALASKSLRIAGGVVATITLIQSIRRLIKYRSYFIFFRSLPGEKDFSMIWGTMHKFRGKTDRERIEYMNILTRKFPRLYCIWIGPFNAMVSLNHPDTVKAILKTSEPKTMLYELGLPWLGQGLLLAAGQRWARSRRLLTPAFHFDILKPYVQVTNSAVDVFLDKLDKELTRGESIEMFSHISLCTFDTILRCAMSYTDDDVQTKGRSHPYVSAVTELTELWADRGRNPFLFNNFTYSLTGSGRRFRKQCDFVHSISEKVIKERRDILIREGPPKKRYLDFLDILLTARDELGTELSDLEIRSEVDTFMFEGHDTTASAISWTLHSLSTHPDIQVKVQEEIDDILQGRDSDELTWEDLGKMEYLTQVIKEGMRLHCPVPFIGRVLTQPTDIDGQVTLPEGTICTVNLLNLHHNTTVWSNPWTFDPDRYHPDNIKSMDSYAAVPFSAGPRNCIGQHFALNEQKVILGRLLRRFTFTADPSCKVEKKLAIVMRTHNGMKMFLKPRNVTA